MKDEFTSKIIQALKTGTNLEKLGHTNYEHTIQEDCLFRGNRVVIPSTLQPHVLKEIQMGHLGIVKMKALARSYCYWINFDQDIGNLSKCYKQCCLKQRNPSKENIHPWETSKCPWQKIHIDFAEPCMRNNYFLLLLTLIQNG